MNFARPKHRGENTGERTGPSFNRVGAHFEIDIAKQFRRAVAVDEYGIGFRRRDNMFENRCGAQSQQTFVAAAHA